MIALYLFYIFHLYNKLSVFILCKNLIKKINISIVIKYQVSNMSS